MTREFRRIIFSNKTLRNAVDLNTQMITSKIPTGDITSIKSVRKGSEFLFELVVFDYTNQKNETLKLSEFILTETLIHHCLNNGIALPRNSIKSIRLVDDNLCLDIFMNTKTPSDLST